MYAVEPSIFHLLGVENGVTFDHVGLAVRSIAASWPDAEVIHDPTQGVNIAFVDVHGVMLELVEQGSAGSPVDGVLARGQTIYHLCYRVTDLDAALDHARSRGAIGIGKPVPAAAFGGRRILWLYHDAIGLIELVEAEA